MKYPSAARITRRQDIERIRKEGRALRTGTLVARMSPSRFSSMRVGVVVPRYGHSAVDRNRLKRRVRELVRTMLLPREDALDVVLWTQASAYQQSYAELAASLQRVIDRMDGRSATGQ